MELFWVLLFLSFPIFYIYGLVSFIRDISNRKRNQSQQRSTIAEKLEVPRPPADYEPEKNVPLQQPVRTTFLTLTTHGWYSEHSIHLLLYIGAFLVVASAAAFVGVTWDTIGGIGRALVLTFVCIGFYISGFAALINPKIKQAAYTFIAIGTILIPFVHWGWYVFVLKGIGVSSESVWFFSSLLTFLVSILLARYIQQRWYVYVNSLSVLSGMLSLVQISDLSQPYYVLMSVLSAYIFFMGSLVAMRLRNVDYSVFAVSYATSAKILMPLSLFYGLLVAISSDLLFSFEAVLLFALGAFYYLIHYLVLHASEYFAVTQLLFLVFLFLFGHWLGIELEGATVLLSVCGVAYVIQSPIFMSRGMSPEGTRSWIVGLGTCVATFIVSVLAPFTFGYQVFLACVAILISIYVGWQEKRWEYGWIAGMVSAYLLQYVLHFGIDLPYRSVWYGISYVLIGLILWSVALLHRQKDWSFQLTVLSLTGLFYGLGVLWSLYDEHLSIFVWYVLALLYCVHAFVRHNKYLVYCGMLAIIVGTAPLLSVLAIDFRYYPLIYTGIAYAIYGIMVIVKSPVFEQSLRYSGLLICALVPLFFAILMVDTYRLENQPLMTAYAASILLSIDAYLRKDLRVGYIASAYILFVYIWQMLDWNVETVQLYTLPTGLYFLGLGYHREYKKDPEKAWIFYYLGIACIIVPTFFQMWGNAGMGYAGLMLLYGLGLFSFGVTKEHKLFKNVGILAIVLAVFSQLYGVIMTLEWYLILGIFGLSILGLAVWLSNRRR